MGSLILIRIMTLPGLLMQRGPRTYYGGTLALQALGLTVAAAWLITPTALWSAYGHWWMLLWLVPTAAAIFAHALTPMPGEG